MKDFLTALFDFILPRTCQSCHNKLSTNEEVLCQICFSSMQEVSAELNCHEFERKFLNDGIISGMFSLYQFGQGEAVRDLIHSLKYGGRFQNGVFLGRLIGQKASLQFRNWEIDLIIPVPLHRLKKAQRGYNQSFYIAKGMSKATAIPAAFKLLKRIRNTKSQTNLNFSERKENVLNAFRIRNKKLIEGKNVIILDDVITTGSTLVECAKVLKTAGAKSVYAVSTALA